MAIEYNFTLDMDRSKRDNNIAYARTGDVDSIVINADLVFNGAAYTPSGTNAFFECITPNGRSIRAAAEKTGSSVSVEVPPAAFQAAGVINVAYFRFETGSADNPTYVESTEPFAIVVREGIGDNIDAGDYIEEWRGLADQLEAVVAEVEQKAEQAETAIDEQKTEVDKLKAQAQVSIAQDAEDVSDAKDAAISNINGSQGAVDAAIDKLEQKTQEAVDAAQDALDGTLATNLQNAIDRTLKLDVADMTDIPSNTSLSSLTDVGSYCCKTAASAATIGDSPVDDSPFNMYVFSSSTSGQVMQLVVPIDLNSKPTAEWHVRFGTSSAMDKWSVIGGGADIAAGLGIDVTGDAQKTVSLDTTAFYQHHEATDIIQGSTEVTGGGRVKELTVYGNTRQNLWVNPSGTSNGVNVTANANGSITLSGKSTSNNTWIYTPSPIYSLRCGSTYTLSVMGGKSLPDNADFRVECRETDGSGSQQLAYVNNSSASATFTVPDTAVYFRFIFRTGNVETALSGTYRIMLNEGSTAEPWCPPGLNGVDELSVVCAGKNLLPADAGEWVTSNNTSVSIDGDIVTVSSTSGTYSFAGVRMEFLAGMTVHFGRESASGGYAVMQLIYSADGKTYFITTADSPHTVPSYATNISIRLYCNNSVNNGAYTTVFTMPYLRVDGIAEYTPLSGFVTTPIDLDGHALNSLPDGTRDELRIDGTGAVTIEQQVSLLELDGSEPWVDYQNGGKTGLFGFNVSASYGMKYPQVPYCDTYAVRSEEGGSVITYQDYFCGIDQNKNLWIKDPRFTTLSAFKAHLATARVKFVAQLATPKEVELPGISMPDLASPDYTVFASSNVPAEIEAEVVKVDYLPPSDVYTKKEVDQKIEDAGMPDVVPVSKGGTGVTTAAAERNRLGLGNTTGALSVANGGTGASDAKAAEYNILGGMITDGSDPNDASNFAMVRGEPSSEGGVLFKRKGTNVWNWIVSKIRSTFGFTSGNVLPVANGGTGASSAASARANLSVYSKTEVDGKVPKVVYGTGNIPGDAANGTIYIQYRS